MKHIGAVCLSLILAACSSDSDKSSKRVETGKNLPKVQQEYQRLQQWTEKLDSMDKMLAKLPTGNDELRVQQFMMAYHKNLVEAQKSGAKLDLTDKDVKRMRDIYLELMTISEGTMPAFVHSHPPADAMWKLQAATPKLNKLEEEFEFLDKRVQARFKR